MPPVDDIRCRLPDMNDGGFWLLVGVGFVIGIVLAAVGWWVWKR